jgi:hypothetical protein
MTQDQFTAKLLATDFKNLEKVKKGDITMTTKENLNSPQATVSFGNKQHRQIALIAGFGLLLMSVSIILAEAVAMAGIIIEGDAAATVNNILNNQGRFRFGIVAHLIVILLDLVVAWALYVFLKPAKDNLSLLAAWSRLVYTVFYGMALINVYSVFQLLGSADYLSVFEASEIQAQVMLSLNAFRDTWDVGYIFFGLHLTLLGVVACRSGFIPKYLGILLLIAGVSYLIDYIGLLIFPDLGVEISIIFGWGELIFMLWLLIRGGKAELPESE